MNFKKFKKLEMENIEIKAKVHDDQLSNMFLKAKELSGNDGEIIEQHDIFFNTAKSRLKLRKFEDGTAELISYLRSDVLKPKASVYHKTTIHPNAIEQMELILTKSLGVLGSVNKRRYVFNVERTRIHIDIVDNLGVFIELEVMMRSDDENIMDCDCETANKIAIDLMQKLSIKEEDLIAGAYIDLLMKKFSEK